MILFELGYQSFVILFAGGEQSNPDSSSSNDEDIDDGKGNGEKENDGDAKDKNGNDKENKEEVKTTEKPNGNFLGTKLLSNGMEARKGKITTKFFRCKLLC